MSRILRRPMFRGGGKVSSYGNGIASGLADGGRVGYLTGGEILQNLSDANTLFTDGGGGAKKKIFGMEIPGTGQALDKDGNPYDPKYIQEQLKENRDQLNTLLGFTPIGRSARGLNVVRSAYSKFPGFRSGLPSASKVKDFFTKSPQSSSTSLGPYKGPAPFGTNRYFAEKLRPAFQNTGAALKDTLGGAGKLKDYAGLIGVGGIGGSIGLAKGYEAFKERQKGTELQTMLEDQIKKDKDSAAAATGKDTTVDINTGEPVESRKDRLKRTAKEYQEILGDGIKKDSIFDAMVEGGSRLYEGEGLGSSLRAANKALDPIQNIKTASRKLALEEDIAMRKAMAVSAGKSTEMSRRIAAMRAAGRTPEQIADMVAGIKPETLGEKVSKLGKVDGYAEYIKENQPDVEVVTSKVDVSKKPDGKYYIADKFTIVEVKNGAVVVGSEEIIKNS